MSLSIPSTQLSEELLPKLRETFLEEAGELRLDLPEEWSIFWKKREDDSRLLIAHPQKDQWVATVALTEEYATKVLHEVSTLTAGESYDFGKPGSVCNLELVISAT
jgi:hypothetical protein